jgi:putative tributyrin esterase
LYRYVFFHLSDKREDNFIAGLSMGGYSAFKSALRCPEKYIAAASLSGVLDII